MITYNIKDVDKILSKSKCLLFIDWSKWDDWGPCDKKCGGGLKMRMRKCIHGPGCKGPEKEAVKCNTHPCQCTLLLLSYKQDQNLLCFVTNLLTI